MLDEADHMADLGFLPGVKRLLDAHPAGRPAAAVLGHARQRRSTCWSSATCTTRSTHSVDSAAVAGARDDAPRASACRRDDKPAVVRELARRPGPQRCSSPAPSTPPRSWPSSSPPPGIPAVDLHGNLSQNARERNLAAFSERLRPRCWSPPTSRPAASTSTTSTSSCTSTRRPSTRRTCTAPAAPPAPAPRASSSP